MTRFLAILTLVMSCSGGSQLPEGEVIVLGTRVSVEIADTAATRTQGLSGRAGLEPGRGMLFRHDAPGIHGYWMKDMHFAIDILWLRDGRIVDVAHRAGPPASETRDADLRVYAPRVEADTVLEVPAGYARAHGWDIGARVSIDLAGR